MFDIHRYAKIMARYNTLANVQVYKCCREMPLEDLRQDRGAYFGSIFQTLNHLWTGDNIWMTRFEGEEIGSTDLGAIVFDEFEALEQARIAMDQRIEAFFESPPENFFAGVIEYRNNSGVVCADAVEKIIPHFFNHQTHHRGQIHGMLTQAGAEAPVLDLHRVLDGVFEGF